MVVQALRELSAIAIVRCKNVDVGVWRRRLDKLGYPSVEFESFEGLFSAVESGSRFFAAFIPVSVAKCDLEKIYTDGIQILLIVSDDEWDNPEIISKDNSILRRFQFISCDATEFEWKFRAGLLFNINNQEKRSEVILLKSGVENNFRHKYYEILILERRILYKGCDTLLNPREYDVAVLLFLNSGSVLPRSWILNLVWGGVSGDSRALDVCISRLREKLCLRGQNIIIRSVYRKGYQLLDAGEIDKYSHSLDKIVSDHWGRAEN